MCPLKCQPLLSPNQFFSHGNVVPVSCLPILREIRNLNFYLKKMAQFKKYLKNEIYYGLVSPQATLCLLLL